MFCITFDYSKLKPRMTNVNELKKNEILNVLQKQMHTFTQMIENLDYEASFVSST